MNPADLAVDELVRAQAFALVRELNVAHEGVIPFAPLSEGLQFQGQRVPLIGPQGIFKPRVLKLPLSITTSPSSPYNDTFTPEGSLKYSYRGTDPHHVDNVGMREVMRLGRPLVYLHGVVKGRYLAAWPVYVTGDDPARLTFTVEFDDQPAIEYSAEGKIQAPEILIRRRYATAAVRMRLHQRLFRERVLDAYRSACSLCRLAHRALLEAAHIIPDAEKDGEPLVSNGVSFCKLHHAAFDQGILGVRPDYVVEIREDVLEEVDGPMLKHGLQAMHKTKLWVPHSAQLRPDQKALEYRYEKFRAR